MRPAEWAQRQDLDVASRDGDVSAGGGLDLIDLALPFVGDGGPNVDERRV